MTKPDKQKICFIVAPIGEEESDIRRRSDQILTHIISPVAKEFGYETIRADKISEPGIITSQIIQHLLDDALVIADLTGHNANVFYEIAIRHAVRKPIVQLIQTGEQIPFDVAQSRTIRVDHHDLDSVAECRDELVKHIQKVEQDPTDVDTPISIAIDIQSLKQSKNPLEKNSVEIISMLQDLRLKVDELCGSSRQTKNSLTIFYEFSNVIRRLEWILGIPQSANTDRSKFEENLRLIQTLRSILAQLASASGISFLKVQELVSRSPGMIRQEPTKPPE